MNADIALLTAAADLRDEEEAREARHARVAEAVPTAARCETDAQPEGLWVYEAGEYVSHTITEFLGGAYVQRSARAHRDSDAPSSKVSVSSHDGVLGVAVVNEDKYHPQVVLESTLISKGVETEVSFFNSVEDIRALRDELTKVLRRLS